MSSAIRMPLPPRYMSAADVAAVTGLSLRTIRRRVKDGTLRGVKLGRRVLIPSDAIERPQPPEAPPMSTARATTAEPPPYVPAVSAEELGRNGRGLVELLDSWEADGDETEQRETMDVLRESLGARRVSSARNLFP